MKKVKATALALALVMSMSSCYTLTHTVGQGAQSGQSVQQKQWFALWGLVPINTVDSNQMAAGAENYTIVTQHSFVDLLISAFTGFVTVQVKTVEVRK